MKLIAGLGEQNQLELSNSEEMRLEKRKILNEFYKIQEIIRNKKNRREMNTKLKQDTRANKRSEKKLKNITYNKQ